MILKAWSYLFYKFYSWQLKLHGEVGSPYATALITMFFLNFLNFYSLVYVIKIFTGYDLNQVFYNVVQFSKVGVILGLMAFLLCIHFFCIKKNIYKGVVKKFKSESHKDRIKGNILTWCYVVASFFIFVFFIILTVYADKSHFTVINYLYSKFS